MMPLPKTFRIRQSFDPPQVEDVPAEVHARLARLRLGEKIRPAESVAITVGSRGIAGIDVIVRAIVEHLRGAATAAARPRGSAGWSSPTG